MHFEEILSSERIFVTGHSGFTGSWLCHWLGEAGIEYFGYSLEPETNPNLFYESGLEKHANGMFGDILDVLTLNKAIADFRPTLILHLAAQPLVRLSYKEPLSTFAINALGTANVLEVAKNCDSVKGVLCITTDKVYKNNEWSWRYRENDPLGGKDPYSASKAAAEIIISSYRDSFPDAPPIAVARGGNIIGGGDWSADRLIPDFVRAVQDESSITLRYPKATRPWQHVLALVEGYLKILGGLVEKPNHYARAWNLGPVDDEVFSVKEVFELLCENWQRPDIHYMDNPAPEAKNLALDSHLAQTNIGWSPKWDTEVSIRHTALWYKNFYQSNMSCRDITVNQINLWRHGQPK